MNYPTELIARSEFEIEVFERVSADTGRTLLAEVKAWRSHFPEYKHDPETGVIVAPNDKETE